MLLKLGVLQGGHLVSGHKEDGNRSTERGKVCRVGQNHNPVVVLRDKLGSLAWLGKPPPCSYLFSLLLRSLSLGIEVGLRFFLSCLGEGQKENLSLISSISGP